MSLDEFSLIRRYFSDRASASVNSNVILGIGDDAAVIQPPPQVELVSSIDTLVAGRHFPDHTAASDIAYKSLAVNVSDLAAMAAEPAFFLLSLTMPAASDKFLRDFADGLFAAASEFEIDLVGGDTCRGPLSISIQANGYVPAGRFVSRAGARPGDLIMVSGQLGNAALGLALIQQRLEPDPGLGKPCIDALNRPQPRLDMRNLLRQYATAAIDVSDGLVGDLRHILEQSGVGARIDKQKLPVVDWIRQQDEYDYALAGGDDYQILFTLAAENCDQALEQALASGIDLTVIGEITESAFVMIDDDQQLDLSNYKGFDHFDT
ncbi:MAG: thiamine-phosphate kinase [Gammaproteobacteria bacterium]|nr:thiamine-phosphate kinase [Gammaproteobacteria bacterium]